MTYEETAKLLDGMLNYWPNLFRGNDPESMVKAWAVALANVPRSAAARGCAVLAIKLKFPPSVAEVVQAAQEFMPRNIDFFDIAFAKTCHEDLGFDTPVYRKMISGEIQPQYSLAEHG